MAWKRRKPKHDWRVYLTTEEAKRVGELDRIAQEIDAKRSALTRERYLITNRAIQRARYAEGKA